MKRGKYNKDMTTTIKFRLSQDEIDALKEFCENKRKTNSEIIRTAVKQYIKNEK